MKRENIGILIPAFNEEETVGEVVRRAKRYGTVIVLDDGSKDKTKEIATQAGAIVFSHSENQGLGYTLRTLFAIALKNEEYVKRYCKPPVSLKELPNFKTLVTIDSDGQHDPDEIPKLVNSLEDFEFCLGVRDLSVYPAIKQIGNFGLNFLTNIFSLTRFHDTECGFRAFKRETLERIFPKLKAKKYEIALDIISEIGWDKVKYTEVPVRSPRYRYGVGVIGGFRNFVFLLKKAFNHFILSKI